MNEKTQTHKIFIRIEIPFPVAEKGFRIASEMLLLSWPCQMISGMVQFLPSNQSNGDWIF